MFLAFGTKDASKANLRDGWIQNALGTTSERKQSFKWPLRSDGHRWKETKEEHMWVRNIRSIKKMVDPS